MKGYEWVIANFFNLIGALICGLSVPVSEGFFIKNKPLLDTLILCPIGLIFIGFAVYYKFIKKY